MNDSPSDSFSAQLSTNVKDLKAFAILVTRIVCTKKMRNTRDKITSEILQAIRAFSETF